MSKIDEKLIDEMAELEVNALLEGLKDPEIRHNPAFLDKVRKFLKDNAFMTTAETPGMKLLQKQITPEETPVFDDIIPFTNKEAK